MLFTIDSVYDDIDVPSPPCRPSRPTRADGADGLQGKAVGDLGCGGGTLGLGCAMLGAGSVLGVDIDPDSLALVSAATPGAASSSDEGR